MIDTLSLCCSDDNKKNTFNNGGNNRHGLKNITCKQTLSESQWHAANSNILGYFFRRCAHVMQLSGVQLSKSTWKI